MGGFRRDFSGPLRNPPVMRLLYLLPLAGFVVSTLIIGYGVVIPSSSIAGVNELTIGFGTTILGACLAYVAGIQIVIKNPPGT